MDEMVNLILNSSVTIVVLAYFMYRDNKFMTRLDTTLQSLVDTVEAFKENIRKEEK